MVDMLLEVCDWRRIQWCFVTCFRRFCWRFSRCDPNHCGLSSMFFTYSYLRMYSFTMAYQRRNRKEMSPVNSLVRVIENVWRYLSFAGFAGFAPANLAAQLRQWLLHCFHSMALRGNFWYQSHDLMIAVPRLAYHCFVCSGPNQKWHGVFLKQDWQMDGLIQ